MCSWRPSRGLVGPNVSMGTHRSDTAALAALAAHGRVRRGATGQMRKMRSALALNSLTWSFSEKSPMIASYALSTSG